MTFYFFFHLLLPPQGVHASNLNLSREGITTEFNHLHLWAPRPNPLPGGAADPGPLQSVSTFTRLVHRIKGFIGGIVKTWTCAVPGAKNAVVARVSMRREIQLLAADARYPAGSFVILDGTPSTGKFAPSLHASRNVTDAAKHVLDAFYASGEYGILKAWADANGYELVAVPMPVQASEDGTQVTALKVADMVYGRWCSVVAHLQNIIPPFLLGSLHKLFVGEAKGDEKNAIYASYQQQLNFTMYAQFSDWYKGPHLLSTTFHGGPLRAAGAKPALYVFLPVYASDICDHMSRIVHLCSKFEACSWCLVGPKALHSTALARLRHDPRAVEEMELLYEAAGDTVNLARAKAARTFLCV